MQQLIKITSVPMQTVRMTQNARLVSSDSVDIERRKALARQMSFRQRHTSGAGSLPMDDITKINRTFSRRNVPSQSQTVSRQQEISKQQAFSRQQMNSVQTQPVITDIPDTASSSGLSSVSETAYTTAAVSSSADLSQEFSSSYHAQLGSLEMRVAKGDLTFLPPMVMTIVTQRPELHFEYLGEFNYVPPRDGATGSNINLFT